MAWSAELLDLDPLPVTALGNPLFQSLYRFSHFNPIQTQVRGCRRIRRALPVFGCAMRSEKMKNRLKTGLRLISLLGVPCCMPCPCTAAAGLEWI
jgi:hypothetical protein